MPTAQVSSPSESRNPTDRLSPLTSAISSRTPSSAPASTVRVRKIAASVIGLRIACGSAEGIGLRRAASRNIDRAGFIRLQGGG
jgi:hypothetical protein